MASIRLRFNASDVYPAGYIRAAQLGWPYSHVDAAVCDSYLGAHLGGGVALRPIGYDAGATAGEWFRDVTVDDDAAKRFRAFLVDQLGKPYDVAAIAHFVSAVFVHPAHPTPERDWAEPSSWICSELIAAALIHAGVLPHELAVGLRHVTPQLLAVALAATGRAAS